jgi:hypothetical protein
MLLKTGTTQAWNTIFNVVDYKLLANVVGCEDACPLNEVAHKNA